ncbi:CRISPR-associated RAMP protein Csx7 [Myxococcota bacterium]|nr:CRISPR-associated RAMP protein Csx7 [Myxococcota bacterium]
MLHLQNRVRLSGKLVFRAAFHLGTGNESESGTDMSVLLDYAGKPLLPGSSLKGVFRSTTERLCHFLGASTCFLDKHQGVCAGGNQELSKRYLEALHRAKSEHEIESILDKHLCDICKLFGSSLAKGKVYFQDGPCSSWAGALERRDGVGIDRDAGTAVPNVKYDYDVVPAGAQFDFLLQAENITEKEERLLQMTFLEWTREVHLGGMTTRGFGAAELKDATYQRVDLRRPKDRLPYLLDRTMQNLTLEEIKADLRKGLEQEATHA